MIVFDSVSKSYRTLRGGPVAAVRDFSLEVRAGEVFGLAGPNGAGKSTLISLLLGYQAPSSGSVTIDGAAPRRYVEEHGIGYLSELLAIPPSWRAGRALRRYALLAGVPLADLAARVGGVIERLGLGEHERKLIKHLSKGNLQRVGLAQALLHDERIVILDEPTHGLDPMWTRRFRDLVASLRDPGRAIFIASHNLDELERISDRVAIIDRGRLQRIVDLRHRAAESSSTPYHLVLASGAGQAAEIFPGARATAPNEFDLPAVPLETLNARLSELMARGGLVVSVAPVHTHLEQQFREAVVQ